MLWRVKSNAELSENLVLNVAIISDVGCVRSINEDSAIYLNPNRDNRPGPKDVLVVVADGMGGHAAGEVASRMAIDQIIKEYYRNGARVSKKLNKSLQSANSCIYEHSKTANELQGMGTTCVVLAISNGCAYGAHIGDSRIYHVRAGRITALTEDHSLVGELLRNGLITKPQARSHPDRNVVLRALGTKQHAEITAWSRAVAIKSGDRFVLSSDGLHDVVDDDEIREAAAGSNPHGACELLVNLAKQRGGYDNITVAIVGCDHPRADSKNVRDTRGV